MDQPPPFLKSLHQVLATIDHGTLWQEADFPSKVAVATQGKTAYCQEKGAHDQVCWLTAAKTQILKEGLDAHSAVLKKFDKDCAQHKTLKEEVDPELNEELETFKGEQMQELLEE